MSTDQKVQVNFYTTIVARIAIIALTTLTSIVFFDIRDSIKDIKADIKSIYKDTQVDIKAVAVTVDLVDKRVIKIETILEDTKEKK